MNPGQDHPDAEHRFVAIRERYGHTETEQYFEDADSAIACAKAMWETMSEQERRSHDTYAGRTHSQIIRDETGAEVHTWDEVHVLWDAWDKCLGADPPRAPKLASATTTARIRRNGNSLTVTITEQAELLGLTQGDAVEITIRRAQD